MTVVTVSQFISMCETVVRNHTPYVFGGISLTKGCDCSGMIYGARIALGLPPGPRTTQEMRAQWGFIPIGQQQIGDLPIFDVPSDDGDPPQHIGVYLGNGTMVEEPHTGLFGEITGVPNTPGEELMGYLRMPDVVQEEPAPPPPVFIQTEKNMLTRNTSSINGGGFWGVRPNASVYTFDGAEYIGPHATWSAKWGIGTPSTPIVGIAEDGVGGFALLADSGGPQPEIYNIPADGRYSKPTT